MKLKLRALTDVHFQTLLIEREKEFQCDVASCDAAVSHAFIDYVAQSLVARCDGVGL